MSVWRGHMYWLDHADLQLISRRLGPQARTQPVVEDLRGWRWDRPPLSPVFDAPLTVEEVAGVRCPTGRDVYLAHVLGVSPAYRAAEIEAAALRATVRRAVVAAKRAVYEHGAHAAWMLPSLPSPALGEVLPIEAPAPPGLAERVGVLWAWECGRIAARVAEVMAVHPQANADALVALAIPVVVGWRAEARYLGLAAPVEADGVLQPLLAVTVLCFRPPRAEDRLVATGLALALEAVHEWPVDVGLVVSGGFADGLPTVRRELFVIDDELRQQFIEQRDEKARLVQEEIDPGVAEACPEDCPFWRTCHGAAR